MKRLLPLLLLMLAVGCATDQSVISQAAQFHSGIQPAVINSQEDPVLNEYINRVGQRIIATAQELDRQGYRKKMGIKAAANDQWMFSNKMQFHFVVSKTLNAFTTGGEHMYIYTALFEQCSDENELAAVMSHEYGHVYCRHVQSGTNRQMAIAGLAAGAGVAGSYVGSKTNNATYATAIGTGAGVAGGLAGAYFTRGDESQADRVGFDFYTHAGWDPDRFGAFFQHMIDLGLDKGVAFLSDHPSLASRVQSAKQWAAQLPPAAKNWRRPPIADNAQFKALQDRARQLDKSKPASESLANAQILAAAIPRSCLTPAIQPDQLAAQKVLVQRVEAQQQQQPQQPQQQQRQRQQAQ
jgi:predicted Zn-dependent protease